MFIMDIPQVAAGPVFTAIFHVNNKDPARGSICKFVRLAVYDMERAKFKDT